MSTLATMRARIANDINRTDLNTQIDLGINRAILYYQKSVRFWFNETTSTFATVASQESYGTADGLPSDIQEIDIAKITLASSNIPELIRRTYKYIQDKNIGNFVAPPSDYAFYTEKIWLYPIPDSIYTITLSYLKSYATLSNDGDSNDFTDNAEDLIEARARAWIYRRLLMNYDAAREAESEERDALLALRTLTTRLSHSGYVRSTDF